MNVNAIIAHRLTNQHLTGPLCATPMAVVGHFGAMQAQDYYGAKWAVGQRCGSDDAAIEALFDQGRILRTHLCRPTWHFVLPEDIHWMLALTAPRVHQANAFMYRKFGLDTKLLARATDIIANALSGGRHLEREALMTALQRARIDTSEFRSSYIMMHAELEGVVCSGPRQGKQFTYALLDERVPNSKVLTREEALAELTRRYFTSRGPASLYDFTLWSGLTMAEAKRGIASVESMFTKMRTNERDNWYAQGTEPMKVPANTVHLIPNYDEYGIGYKDRSAFSPVIERANRAPGPLPFRHLVLLDGRMAGTWTNTTTTHGVTVQLAALGALTRTQDEAVRATAERYAAFLGVPLTFSNASL